MPVEPERTAGPAVAPRVGGRSAVVGVGLGHGLGNGLGAGRARQRARAGLSGSRNVRLHRHVASSPILLGALVPLIASAHVRGPPGSAPFRDAPRGAGHRAQRRQAGRSTRRRSAVERHLQPLVRGDEAEALVEPERIRARLVRRQLDQRTSSPSGLVDGPAGPTRLPCRGPDGRLGRAPPRSAHAARRPGTVPGRPTAAACPRPRLRRRPTTSSWCGSASTAEGPSVRRQPGAPRAWGPGRRRPRARPTRGRRRCRRGAPRRRPHRPAARNRPPAPDHCRATRSVSARTCCQASAHASAHSPNARSKNECGAPS